MNDSAFDGFTRGAAVGISRRTSLMALGGAGLAALAKPTGAEAKRNSNKKAKKKIKKKANQKCKKQVPQCEAAITQAGGTPQERLCCQFLSNCDATAFIQCLAAN